MGDLGRRRRAIAALPTALGRTKAPPSNAGLSRRSKSRSTRLGGNTPPRARPPRNGSARPGTQRTGQRGLRLPKPPWQATWGETYDGQASARDRVGPHTIEFNSDFFQGKPLNADVIAGGIKVDSWEWGTTSSGC